MREGLLGEGCDAIYPLYSASAMTLNGKAEVSCVESKAHNRDPYTILQVAFNVFLPGKSQLAIMLPI